MSPLADVSFETLQGVVVARLAGEVDMSNASELGAAITARVPSDARGLVLDLDAVGYVDSAGIHIFFELRERLTRRGQGIRVSLAAESPVATALEYAGVQRTLGGTATVRDAIDDLLNLED
jgi:anti-sigma B factor antagonist